MVSEGKSDSNFEKDWESNGESNVWCKTEGEKEDRGPDGDVGIEGNSGSDAKANGLRWYGHVLRRDDWHVLRKVLEFEVKGKRKWGEPKKDVEDASGEGEQERWFGEKGRHESSEMERGKFGHPRLRG